MNIQTKQKIYWTLGHILGTAQALEQLGKDSLVVKKASLSIQKDIEKIIELYKEDIDN